MRRHRTSDDLRAIMHRAMGAPTVLTGDGERANPLAALQEVGESGTFGALLNAWATVGDVVTFYQDRIADEASLSTAREPYSAYAISRGIGHRPNPAMSASVDLAFNLGVPATDAEVVVPAGTAVGNVPTEGALPAIFETSLELRGVKAWNAIPSTPNDAPADARLAPAATRIVLAGTTPIVAGDALVVRCGTAGAPDDEAAIIADASVDVTRDRTLVRWSTPFTDVDERVVSDVIILDTRVRVFGALAPPFELAAAAERRKYAYGGVFERGPDAWSPENEGLDGSPLVLAALRDGWCGITRGTYLRRRRGEPWTTIVPAPGVTLQTLTVSASGRVAIGTANGDVYVSSDDGDIWMRIGGEPGARGTKSLPPLPIRGIALDERGEIPDVYVATDRGVAQIALNGNAWAWRNAGFPGTDPVSGFAACSVSSIVFDAATSTMIATTTYGAYLANGRGWARIDGLGNVFQIDALTNGRFVACGPGGVFLSQPGAYVWTKVIEPESTPSALAAAGDTIGVAAGNDAYTSDDGGATWTRSPDVGRSRISDIAVDRYARVAVSAPFIDNPLRDWPGLDEPLRGTTLILERVVPLQPGAIIAISKDGAAPCRPYRVRRSSTRMLHGYGMSALGTVVTLDTEMPGDVVPREAIVHVNAKTRVPVPVRRGAMHPLSQSVVVPRSVPLLPSKRSVFVEGRAPQAVVKGLAGNAFRLHVTTDVATAHDGESAMISPERDVVDAVVVGDGIALCRFDGVWRCDQPTLTPRVWSHLPAIPVAGVPRSLAELEGVLHVVADQRVFAFHGANWAAEASVGTAVRRVLSWSGSRGGILVCAERGAFIRYDGAVAWQPAVGLENVEVLSVASDGDDLVVGTGIGVFRRMKTSEAWMPVAGLVPRAVPAVALDRGNVYAGTAGGGLWIHDASGWTASQDVARDAQVLRLAVVTTDSSAPASLTVVTTDGVFVNGKRVSIGLADVSAPLLRLATAPREIVGFRATPSIGGTPLRTFLGTLDDDVAEHDLMDAGMASRGFRDRLAAIAKSRIDSYDIVVEEQGLAWRFNGGDDLPTLLVRREPVGRLGVFEDVRFDVERFPVTRDGDAETDPVLEWDGRIRDGVTRRVRARDSEMWYVAARAGAPIIAERADVAVHTPGQVALASSLAYAFDPQTAEILANVVAATHGATIPVDEPIASGDPDEPGQSARLARKPLTYLFAPDGDRPQPQLTIWSKSTQQLDARVDRGTFWTWTENMLSHGARASVFTTEAQHDGSTIVVFGDGIHGARLPRGTENVVARYRFGAGASGNVAANTLTLLQKVAPYVDRARNPLRAVGGTDADRLMELRRDIPIGLVAFDRVVSQRDLWDYVRGFPGVAKVDVRFIDGSFVVTYAERANDHVDEKALLLALRNNGADGWPIRIAPAVMRTFCVEARLVVAADDATDHLEPARAALLAEFGFELTTLGRDVSSAEIVRSLQRLRGIIAVRLLAMHETGTVVTIEERVNGMRDDVPTLLTVDPAAIDLRCEMLVTA